MNTKKVNLIFDMDWTIADFYNVNDWLEYLINNDTKPYEICNPLVNFTELNTVINDLKTKYDANVTVITWTSKNATKDFHKRTAVAKKSWLKQQNFQYNNIRCVKYRTNKSTVANQFKGFDEQILFDDDIRNLTQWKQGRAYNPTTNDIINILKKLV